MEHVFISYSFKDKNTANQICQYLEQYKIPCWIAPRDILPSSDYGKSIIEAIKGSRILILIYTKNVNSSEFVKREVERAVAYGKAIIPIKVENELPSDSLDFYLSTSQWLEATSPPLNKHFIEIANAVKSIYHNTLFRLEIEKEEFKEKENVNFFNNNSPTEWHKTNNRFYNFFNNLFEDKTK